MKSYITLAVIALAFGFSACKKKQPETIPVPKTGPAASEAAVSTAAVFSQNPLTAPGNYLKNTVGHVKEAKEAKALYEKAAKEGLNGLDLDNTGGN